MEGNHETDPPLITIITNKPIQMGSAAKTPHTAALLVWQSVNKNP